MRKSTAFDAFAQGLSPAAFGWGVGLLRVAMGLLFFWAGWSKVIKDGGWSAAGYLQGASGPLAEWFQSLAGSPVVDVLNMWGLTLIGLALILGLLVRTASFFGILLMTLYYLAHFVDNTSHGLIDEHVVYSLVLFLFLVGGFGHVWGLDGLLERRLDARSKWVRVFFG